MINLSQIELRRGSIALLKDADLVVHPGQRVGIIGANGCGKSSLFKLLRGELHLDAGDMKLPPHWRIAHMAQEVVSSDRSAVDFVLDGDSELRRVEDEIAEAERTGNNKKLAVLYEEMENIQGFNAHYRAEQLLHGLGFTQGQINRPVSSFSGGWQIRLNLAQALMCPSDLLLLDEPTNHLDLDAILWLEQRLRSYAGTLLLISHDRDFIDNVAERIVHIEHNKCFSYTGNYSSFERARAEKLAQQQASFIKQQQRKAEIESFVARFRYKATKARQAQSRLKELQRMEEIAPAHIDSPFHFGFHEGKQAHSALVNLSQASLGYGNTPVLESVNIDLQPGTRIGLLGPNGAGKSTLIKSLTADLPLLAGYRVCGEQLQLGYFAQHQLEALDPEVSAFLHIQRLSPAATEQEIRNFLGGFDFCGDKALGSVRHFSGGERARLALAMIVWQKPNLLLLDEPTNHLDLEMRQALTEALQSYQGALVVISHDRHLLRNTVDHFYLVVEGRVKEFDGDLKDYQHWLKDFSKSGNTKDSNTDNEQMEERQPAIDKKQLRQQAAEKRTRLAPLTKTIKKLERQMEKLHQALQPIEQSLAKPEMYNEENKGKLKELLSEQAQFKKHLSETEDQWMQMQEELEQAQI